VVSGAGDGRAGSSRAGSTFRTVSRH
jgi:hypothetical protein